MALSEAEELELLELEEQEASSQQPSPSGGSSMMDVAGFAASQVSEMAPWNRANTFLKDQIGGGIAEAGGYLGGKLENAGYPTLGKIAQAQGIVSGFGVSMLPEALAAATSLEGIYNSQNPTMKGLVNTPEELSPQYAVQNKAIGVTRRIPQEGGRLPTYPKPELQGLATKQPRPMAPAEPLPGVVPERLPGKPGDFMSYANQKLGQHGSQMNPQELMDWQVKLQTDMANPSRIPRFDPATGRTTTLYQQASDLASRARGQFKQLAEARLKAAQLPEGVMPTRAGLDQAYGLASRVQEYTRRGLGLAWKVGKAGAIGAIATAGGVIGYKALK